MHHDVKNVEEVVSEVLAIRAVEHWMTAALGAGVNLAGFDPTRSRDGQVSWARSQGFDIGTIYSRFSTQMQQSTEDQIRECMYWAAKNNIFVPSDFISVDEAAKGRRVRRSGLQRTQQILASKQCKVLLVYKASRLFRQAGKGFQFIQEEVVGLGLRAVSVSQGIDTADKKTWKLQIQVHGIMDDMLLDTIADHVRDGQKGLFLSGLTTGAVGVGFCAKEVPGGRPTNRGLPRTKIAVDPQAADLIRKHFALVLNGMPIREGVRRWNEAGGPSDPRSTTGKMTYPAYRRLLTNARLTGRFEFGRKRNQFSTKKDYTKQVVQLDQDVTTYQDDNLRIVDDETFFAVQQRLCARATGPCAPRNTKSVKLWDLTTKMFFCAHCSTPDNPVRFYMAGANGRGMRCCNGDQCPHPSYVRRDEAVRAVCKALSEAIVRDSGLVAKLISRSQELDAAGDSELQAELDAAERRLRAMKSRIDALYDFLGQGSDAEKCETERHLRATIAERGSLQAHVNRIRTALDQSAMHITVDQVIETFTKMEGLLQDAAAGDLGDDAVYEALSVFATLTGERIWVTVQPRPGRKQTTVRGSFQLRLIAVAKERLGSIVADKDSQPTEQVSLWLRKPPRLDEVAERVHQLIDVQRMSHRDAARQMQREGHNLNSGNVWYSYRRWYEINNLPVPKVPYNNGHKRESA